MPGPESPERRNASALSIVLAAALVIALLGSLGFLHPTLQALPYSWF